MSRFNKKIAVIGAGVMGLACAYDLLKNGHKVDVYEKDDRIGGMSASFDFDGLLIERFYHFVCAPDYPLFDMLTELGIYDKLKWNDTKMGFYYEGKLYKWGNPLYLLTFPRADLISKFRYGLHVFLSSKRTRWDDLDKRNAVEWVKKALGEKAYDIFWKLLFELKFYEYTNNISAAWIWTRLKRVAVSRKNVFSERMGYLEGGSDILLGKMRERIEHMGGKIFLNKGADKIITGNGMVTGVAIGDHTEKYDSVVSTVPLPYTLHLAPDLPDEIRKKIEHINNIGVVCVILKLKNRLTENFWLNITDQSIENPGMIEYSNLNPLQDVILYVPFYLHKSNPKYQLPNELFFEEVLRYLKKINPELSEDWILAKTIHRYEYAQPVCPPKFLEMLPPIKTDIKGLFIADTSYYYPEDRSISESIRLGRNIANMVTRESN